ncbi:MAG: cellulase family glycosylhydrolase, partial [Oscillospiraceae bacterium]|nr:cellulase family glycosylhydrolase [Oscillospiraceae bacterium]
MKSFEGYKKGVNLGGWLSQCDYTKEHMDSFITEEEFKSIAELGADHVRIPFDYNILEDNEGVFNESGFRYIDYALVLCEKYNLNAVLDLHKAAGFSFDKGENE